MWIRTTTFTATVSPSNATGTIHFMVTAACNSSQGFLASTSAPYAQTFKYAVKIGDQPNQNLSAAFALGGQILARERLLPKPIRSVSCLQ